MSGLNRILGTLVLACLTGCQLMAPARVAAPVAQPAAAAVSEPAPVSQASVPAEPESTGFLPASIEVQGDEGSLSDAAVARAISNKLRANLAMPRTAFPKNAAVTLEAMLAPNGTVFGARVTKGSGYKALDEAVLKALRRAEPLPVTQAMRDTDSLQRITLVFRPFS